MVIHQHPRVAEDLVVLDHVGQGSYEALPILVIAMA